MFMRQVQARFSRHYKAFQDVKRKQQQKTKKKEQEERHQSAWNRQQ